MAASGNPVGWFEIPVSNFDRARSFYEEVFGVTLAVNEVGLLKMAWFPMAREAYGATGSLVKGPGYAPGKEGGVVYFTAPDLLGTLERAVARGGVVLVPFTDLGQYGQVAHLQDCEGNRIGLHRAAERA